MIIPLLNNHLVLDARARDWCKMHYYNHPGGCPNYGKRNTCPPQAPMFQDFLATCKPMLLVVVGFKLGEHIEIMREHHPDWTKYQLRCVLYWQNTPRKWLRNEIKNALQVYPEMIATECPEAMGVNVIETAKRWYPDIKWTPTDIAYKVAICGIPLAEEVKK